MRQAYLLNHQAKIGIERNNYIYFTPLQKIWKTDSFITTGTSDRRKVNKNFKFKNTNLTINLAELLKVAV